jgi:hypothetical protein
MKGCIEIILLICFTPDQIKQAPDMATQMIIKVVGEGYKKWYMGPLLNFPDICHSYLLIRIIVIIM